MELQDAVILRSVQTLMEASNAYVVLVTLAMDKPAVVSSFYIITLFTCEL